MAWLQGVGVDEQRYYNDQFSRGVLETTTTKNRLEINHTSKNKLKYTKNREETTFLFFKSGTEKKQR
jgi:hypothetical protein